MTSPDLLVVAGEASGDERGARLVAELRGLVPELRPFGLGGEELRAAGCETLADSSEIAVVGIAEALKILRRARQIFHLLLDEAQRRGATHALLIDAPDFNLRLARQLAKRGIRVIYYVSPQLWAWRKGRVKTVERSVERMLVLFPFEVDFYREHGVEAVHVGHPLVDELPRFEQAWERGHGEGEPFRLALLPGSRASEVSSLLPAMLGAARELARRLPVAVRLIQAPTVQDELFDRLLGASEWRDGEIERVRRERHRAVADSHLAICASGTATLEVALLGTPLVVIYKLSPFSYYLGRLLVDLPHFSMVNLVLGEGAVPELLQSEAEPVPIAEVAEALLADPEAIAQQRRALVRLRQALGEGGASRRAAEEVARVMALGRAAA